MSKKRGIVLYCCIVICLMTVLLPMQAFAKTDELNISGTEIYIKSGISYKLAAVCDSDLQYSSSDLRVATVNSEGTIEAHQMGEATVTVRTVDGKETESCKVFVDIDMPEEVKVVYPKVHYYQGDEEWGFPRAVRKKACALTSMAMLLKNSGIDTDPADAYERNGKSTGMGYHKLLDSFEKQYDCAVPYDSDYLMSYSAETGKTFIKNPAKNYEAAVREALERHPEGVLCYFVRGRGSHAVVAIADENGTIRYNDAGRKAEKGENVAFEDTWCSHRHRMEYGDLAYMIAIS